MIQSEQVTTITKAGLSREQCCGLVRVTRHDGGQSAIPWTEFYEAGVLLDVAGTPPCVRFDHGVAA